MVEVGNLKWYDERSSSSDSYLLVLDDLVRKLWWLRNVQDHQLFLVADYQQHESYLVHPGAVY